MLVLLSDIVLLAQVDEVDDRLGGQKEERVDKFDLDISSVTAVKCSQNKSEISK